MKKLLTVEGMMCQNCVKHVTRALEGVSGVTGVSVSLEEKKAVVDCPDTVTDDALRSAVQDAGYEITEVQTHEG